jgi:LacI family transcriptional regulator
VTTHSQPKSPTQADVARLAGVSQALVSYVLNETTTVSIPTETRQRILGAIRQLGYVPNTTARRLRTSKTYTVASIIPDITNPFYPAFLRGVQDILDPHGYDLITYNTDGTAENEEKSLRSVMQGRVDGIIVVLFHLSAPTLFPLLARRIAVVRLEATSKKTGEYPLDNLFIDNMAAACGAVTHLIEQGHTRIGLLARAEGPGNLRMAGYRQALTAHGLPQDESLIHFCDFTEEGGCQGMRHFLSHAVRPTAVFASNDLAAIGTYAAIRERGLRIPQDVAVVGFDDIPAATLVTPSLTTVTQFQRQLGRRAAQMLLERLQGHAPQSGRCEEMPYQLIVRDST